MSNSQPQRQRLSRRAFLLTSASACGALALWSFRSPATAAASSGTKTPGMVTLVQFNASGKSTGKVTVPKLVKSDAEWRQQLSPLSYEIARQAGTERPFTGDTLTVHDHGIFRCVCCDT